MNALCLLLLSLGVPASAFVGRAMPRVRQPVARSLTPTALRMSSAATDVQGLLKSNRALVDSLGAIAPEISEMTRLRFAMGFDNEADMTEAFYEMLTWRNGVVGLGLGHTHTRTRTRPPPR